MNGRLPYLVNPDSLRDAKEYGAIEKIQNKSNEANPVAQSGFDLAGYVSRRSTRQGKEVQPEDRPDTLGLHYNDAGSIRPSYFVGAVWLGEDQPGQQAIPLVVKPKIAHLDALAMFTQVAQYGDSQTMENLFWMWPEKPLIPGKPLLDLTLFQVAAYLHALAWFCQRHLRTAFGRVTQNLQGRIKGKLQVAANTRCNLAQARVERAVCSFETVTTDTPANRILKYGLHLAMRFLAQHKDQDLPALWHWARIANAALSHVAHIRITERDFAGMRYGGLMSGYRSMHALARMIMRRLHVEPSGEVKEQPGTVPFCIDMNKLFEAYVGVRLRKDIPETTFLCQHERRCETGSSSFTIRPDFISADGCIVLDAKYKQYSRNGQYAWNNEDIYQVISYSMILANDAPSTRRAFLVYPHASEGEAAFASCVLKGKYPCGMDFFTIKLPSGLHLHVGRVSIKVPVKEDTP